MRINSDDRIVDVIEKVNAALRPLDLSFVVGGECHNGFIEYRLAHTRMTVAPSATITAMRLPPRQSESEPPKAKVMRILIVAGNHTEAEQYAMKMGMSREDWKYAGNARLLEGISNMYVVRVGSWERRKDIDQMNDVLRRASLSGVREIQG